MGFELIWRTETKRYWTLWPSSIYFYWKLIWSLEMRGNPDLVSSHGSWQSFGPLVRYSNSKHNNQTVTNAWLIQNSFIYSSAIHIYIHSTTIHSHYCIRQCYKLQDLETNIKSFLPSKCFQNGKEGYGQKQIRWYNITRIWWTCVEQ